jgi:serine/threonine protein phosphatase PrpC
MSLSEKDSKKLITDLAKYIEEERWVHSDIDKLEKAEKITKDDADFLRKKQSQANRKRDKLEDEIAKVVVARFPARFGKQRGF